MTEFHGAPPVVGRAGGFVRRALRLPMKLGELAARRFSYFDFVEETRGTQTPATFENWVRQHILGFNRGPYWPVHPSSLVEGWRNVLAGVETSPGLMPGCYIQAIGKIRIGDYTQIGPQVGIISANHDPYDLRHHLIEDVTIGRYCWIGMGALILPGVTLGDFTIVGGNCVVTKSVPDGYCVLAGNPARKVRELDRSMCAEHKSAHEYHGYIPKARFAKFRARELFCLTMVTIVDYGAGNINSVANMLRALGAPVKVTADPDQVLAADRLILPGVGHFDFGMAELERRGLIEALNRRVIEEGAPILGICLGAQLLTRGSEEGERKGLGWIAADTVLFDRTRMRPGLKLPNMGWANSWAVRPNPLLDTDDQQARFYYVHAYHLACDDPAHSLIEAEYGYPFTAGIGRDNILGVQFHPEKSHRFGMALLRRYLDWTPRRSLSAAPLCAAWPGRERLRRIRVIPTLLLDRQSRLVKTVRFGKRTYIGDPINAVQIYNKKEVDELIVLDIDATRERRSPDFARIREIASEAFVPLGYGGGTRTMEDIERLYGCGIEKVILSSVLKDDPGLVDRAAKRYGSQAVVACLPVGRGLFGGQKVKMTGGKTDAGDPVALAKELADRGVGEIIVYSIDRDGAWGGYDLELMRRVAEAVHVPVVACGGAGSLADFEAAVTLGGASAAAAGSLFVYQSKGRGVLITYPDQDTLRTALFEKVS